MKTIIFCLFAVFSVLLAAPIFTQDAHAFGAIYVNPGNTIQAGRSAGHATAAAARNAAQNDCSGNCVLEREFRDQCTTEGRQHTFRAQTTNAFGGNLIIFATLSVSIPNTDNIDGDIPPRSDFRDVLNAHRGLLATAFVEACRNLPPRVVVDTQGIGQNMRFITLTASVAIDATHFNEGNTCEDTAFGSTFQPQFGLEDITGVICDVTEVPTCHATATYDEQTNVCGCEPGQEVRARMIGTPPESVDTCRDFCTGNNTELFFDGTDDICQCPTGLIPVAGTSGDSLSCTCPAGMDTVDADGINAARCRPTCTGSQFRLADESCMDCAAGLVSNSDQTDCEMPRCENPALPISEGGGVCRAERADDCATGGNIVDGQIPMPENGVANCTACPDTEVERSDGLGCQARVASNCGTMVFVAATSGTGGTCRAELPTDCPINGEIPLEPENGVAVCAPCLLTEIESSDGSDCQARVITDCTDPAMPVFAAATTGTGGICRAAIASDCATNGDNVDGRFPDPQNNGLANCMVCSGEMIENANGLGCHAAAANECPDGETPRPANGLAVCTECSGGTIKDADGLQCRAVMATDCPAGHIPRPADGEANCTACNTINPDEPVKDTDGLSCRETLPDDCTNPAEPVLDIDGVTCRARRANDCNNTPTPIFVSGGVGGGSCRAVMANDCPATGVIPVPANGLRNCTACENTEVEATDGLMCRLRVAADCGTEIFQNGVCRPVVASDCPVAHVIPAPENGLPVCTACPSGMPVEENNGNSLSCRERMDGDCLDAAIPVFDSVSGNCRARIATDCANTPEPVFVSGAGGGSCRVAAASDCPVEDEIPQLMQPQNGVVICTACQSIAPSRPEQSSNGLSCRGRIATDCTNQGLLLIGGICETPKNCDADIAATSPTAAFRSTLNAAINRCTCQGDNPVLFGDVAAVDTTPAVPGFCAPPLPIATADGTRIRYSTGECESAGWLSTIAISDNYVSERCRIPFAVTDTPPVISPPLRAQSALQPLQVAAGATHESCVLRQHPLFADSAAPPNCSDPELFDDAGLPKNPDPLVFTEALLSAPAASSVRITILRASAAERLAVSPKDRYSFNNVRVSPFSFGGGGGGSIENGEIAIAAGAAAFVGLLVWGSWDGNPNAFSFSPQTSFSHNGRAFHYSYGSRLDFRQDSLAAYWGASRAARGGDSDAWRYVTGIAYADDFWRARFDSVNYDGETNVDASLGGEWRWGSFRLDGGISANVRADGVGEEFAIYWTAGALRHYGRWQIRPSVNLYWREGETFGESVQLHISARREF